MSEHLTEKNLGTFLRERIDPDILYNKRMPGAVRNYRPDYRSEKFKFVVEFDGFRHYQNTGVVLDDYLKTEEMSNLGDKVIRIPYFVQLSSQVVRNLFGAFTGDHSPFLDYPHGFISDKALLPADFCEVGLLRFHQDLEDFNDTLGKQNTSHLIVKSLRDLIGDGDPFYTVAPSTWILIQSK